MAGSPPSKTNAVAESSCFQRTVCLYDWWLIKAENDFQGKHLAVAGVSSKKNEALRVFVSAPIIKRYDVFSLETADGIYVFICGFINKKRTLENGFVPEVFNSFLFGFPPSWESYALDCIRDESTSNTDLGNAVPDNVSTIRPEISSDDVGKTNPTSSLSPEEILMDHEKPFHKDEPNVSKEIGGVNVAYSSGGSRRSARLRNVKVFQKKNQPASGGPLKHLDKEQNSTSVALGNCDGEGLKSYARACFREESTAGVDLCTAAPAHLSAIRLDMLFDDAGKSIPTSSVSPEEALGDCEKPFMEEECNVSKEIGGVNVAYDSGGNRHSARLHNIEDEPNVSKEMGGVNVAHGSGGNRRSARLRSVKVCLLKNQPASGGPPNHPDKEQSSPSVALENFNRDGLKSPVTPTQSQSKGLVNILSEQLVKKPVSRISRPMSAETAGHYKKKRMAVRTKAVSPKRKITKSASAVKSPQERKLSHLNNRIKQKISPVSPESLSLKKSRSGRLLLPPLEFWRNQIPVYNADHEVTEIQEGASVLSPCRGASHH